MEKTIEQEIDDFVDDFADEEALALEIANAMRSAEEYLAASKLKIPIFATPTEKKKPAAQQEKIDPSKAKIAELHADPSFVEQLRSSYSLDYNYIIGSSDLACDLAADYTEEALFGYKFNSPFEVEMPLANFEHKPVDHSKANTITRQIQAFNESQQRSRVPKIGYKISNYKPTVMLQNKYKRNRDHWDNLLKELGLTDPDTLELIMKPDFYDVVPMLISRFKAGVMPQVTTTWTVSPRFIPEEIYLKMHDKPYFKEMMRVVDDPHNGTLTIGTNVFHYYSRFGIKQNLYRRFLTRENKRLKLGLEPAIKNMKFYHESMRMVRHIPRFFKHGDLVSYATVNEVLRQMEKNENPIEQVHKSLFTTIARYKLFRYTFEDRNREYLYYSSNARSSYYRYEAFQPTIVEKAIVIYAPDKRFMNHCFVSLFEKARDFLIKVFFVSDLSYIEHTTDEKHEKIQSVRYMGVEVQLMSMSQFMKKPPMADLIYVDFVEVKRRGSTMMGTYCEANRMALYLQKHGFYSNIVLRAGFSEVYPIGEGYEIKMAALFKAGGLEYIVRLVRCEEYSALTKCFNDDVIFRIASVKTIVENDRRHYIIRGFDYRCIDPIFPVKDYIDFYLPDAVFNMVNQKIKTMAYQHTRSTNKFVTRKEDFLDHFVAVNDREVEDKYRGIASVLIQNNFDVSATASQLNETFQYPIDEAFIMDSMLKIINVSQLKEDIKTAITTTTIVPKTYEFLKKKAPDIDRYMSLFEHCGYDHNDAKLFRFTGVSELESRNFVTIEDYKLA